MDWIKRPFGWLWAHMGNLALISGWLVSFAVPAWAVKAANIAAELGPLAWVIGGFAGMFAAAVVFRIVVSARARMVRSNYDAKMLPHGGPIDPMEKTFERKRIYLNEFALPSHPLIEHKTFVDCEIIGPANILFKHGNSVSEGRPPVCDAVCLADGRTFYNGYIFNSCVFRGCSFQRVTLFVSESEYEQTKNVNWLNWITHPPQPIQTTFPELDFNPQGEEQ